MPRSCPNAREKRSAENADSSYAKVEQFIRDGKINEAQGALDEFNERPAEWHYLQSVVFYKKNWMNESKKQLEIAMQLDSSNEKYRNSYNKLKEKIEYDKHRAETPNRRRRRRRRLRPAADGRRLLRAVRHLLRLQHGVQLLPQRLLRLQISADGTQP